MISIVINCDTRPENLNENGMSKGVVSRDFISDGIFNKITLFKGFPIEVIVFLDKHQEIPQQTLDYLYAICDTVVIRKHTDEAKFNDNNYIAALQLARGNYIAHFDHDVAAFTSSIQPIQEMIDLLEKYDYVSYPSRFSPNPDYNENYDYWWCSTRFFMCKRETLDFTEIKKCLFDSEYLYGKYPASVRNPWTEHIIALISKYTGKGVYYPPIDFNKLAIFSWGNYEPWTLRRLNELPYNEVAEWVKSKSMNYANDIFI